jgi:L-ascorbate metabolism protein UlaG (beta-lactamase superfamily)
MTIKKIGHCCLLVDIDGVKLLTDPGMFTTEQNEIKGLDAIVITHEHGDHFHIDSVKAIRANNPDATIITNKGLGALLEKQNIPHTVIGDGQKGEVKGVTVEGFGTKHAPVYGTMPDIENTGYLFAGKLYFPGDSFHAPGRPVDVLALPVAGPWMKISEAIDHAKEVKPRVAFPVHDWLYRPEIAASMSGRWLASFLEPQGIEYVSLSAGESKEF